MSSRALPSLLAVAALFAACGSEAGGDAGSGNDEPATQLEVEFQATAGSQRASATLLCEPPGGDHPRVKEACAALERHGDALRQVPRDVACTQIYGGPETAAVTGTFRGRRIQARFNRTNGCEIARWEALDTLLRLRD